MDGLAAPNYNPLCLIQTELDVLRDVSQRLTSGGVAFMLTGSMAMNYYAQPRMTRDIDLVVKLASEQIDLLVSMFENEYYVDRHAVARAIAEQSLFNLIQLHRSEKRSIPSAGICETKASTAGRF